MKSLERRITTLEEMLKLSEKGKFENKLKEIFIKYGVPSVDEFIEAIMCRDNLESSNSKWIHGILTKGGKEELVEIFKMIDKFNGEGQE